MKTGQLIKTLMLIATVACSITVFAQQKNQQKQIPNGKWVLNIEYVEKSNGECSHGSAQGHVCQEPSKANLTGIELYTELIVNGDSMLLISSKGSLKTKYDYSDEMDGLFFDSSIIPFSPGGKLIDGKLYIQQKIVNSQDKANPKYLSLAYELKK